MWAPAAVNRAAAVASHIASPDSFPCIFGASCFKFLCPDTHFAAGIHKIICIDTEQQRGIIPG